MKLLEGKVALITGAARGIGKAIAIKYAQEGANIAFTDLVIDENGENTKKEIESYGVKVLAIASNAASFEEAHNAVEQVVKEFGKLDILVNNAGITKDGLMMRMIRQLMRMMTLSDLRITSMIRMTVTSGWTSSTIPSRKDLLVLCLS